MGVTRASHTVPAPALVLLGIVSVQVGAGVAKQLFATLPPAGVVTLRIVVAALVVVAIGRPRRDQLSRVSRADIGAVLALGGAMTLMNYSIYQAFARIPLGIAVTIEFLGPLGVAIAASRRRLDLLWIALAGAGVFALSGGAGGSLNVAGVGFALLAACGWAGYILSSAATGRRFAGSGGLALAMMAASVIILPVGLQAAGASCSSRGWWRSGQLSPCCPRWSRTRWSWRRCGASLPWSSACCSAWSQQ